MKCTNCGNEISANQTCPHCGTAAPAFEAPLPPPIPPQYVTEAKIPKSYKPLSPWVYFGYRLLFSLPLVGFVCLIVFSFDNGNIHLRNFARSYWCKLLIGVIIALLLIVLLLATGLAVELVDEVERIPMYF